MILGHVDQRRDGTEPATLPVVDRSRADADLSARPVSELDVEYLALHQLPCRHAAGDRPLGLLYPCAGGVERLEAADVRDPNERFLRQSPDLECLVVDRDDVAARRL